MSRQRVSGFLVIAGLILAIVGSFVFPSEYYLAESEAERQIILDSNQTGWVVTNWIWVAAGVVTAIGMLIFATQYRNLFSVAGAGLFAAGSLFWVRYAYMRSIDASVTTEGLWMEVLFSWLATIGLALLGIAFILGQFSNWVGYINVGYAILFLIVFILFRDQMYEFFPPQVIFLVASFTGVMSIRSK